MAGYFRNGWMSGRMEWAGIMEYAIFEWHDVIRWRREELITLVHEKPFEMTLWSPL